MAKKNALDLSKQLEALRKNEDYKNASIYTVLLDLVEGSDIEEVFMVLHNVASDLDQRELLESQFEKSKLWKWSRIIK